MILDKASKKISVINLHNLRVISYIKFFNPSLFIFTKRQKGTYHYTAQEFKQSTFFVYPRTKPRVKHKLNKTAWYLM